MNIIIPLCGIGKRFTDIGYNIPKPLIKICDKSMINHVLDNIHYDEEDKIFIIYHYSLNEYQFSDYLKKYSNITLIPIFERTQGAAETILYGINYILDNNLSDHKKCLIIDCDTVYYSNIIKKFKKINSNGVCYFTDNGSIPHYSYITLDSNNNIIDIKEKEQISKNANTGAYFFIDIINLMNACKYIISNNIRFKNEYYISCVINHMIESKDIFQGIFIKNENFVSLGTPDDVKRYIDNTYAFLFDLDGTLVLSDDIYFNVWKKIMLKYNINLTKDIFNDCIHSNSDEIAMEKLNIKNDCYNLKEISNLKDEYFKINIDNIILINGVVEFMKKIKKLGHRICIVTNCNRNTAETIIHKINIEKYIDYIIIGSECKKPKPYPDPYLKASDMIQISSDKCIIFEDSKQGIISALHISPKLIVGINSYDNYNILEEMKVNKVIKDFKEIEVKDCIYVNNKNIINELKEMIYNSTKNTYDIEDIIIDTNKLKGGYISDVIKVKIKCKNEEVIHCVFKYENDYTSSLTKMAYTLGLFDREYYFYESLSNYININIPRFYGIIRDKDLLTKGILLEDINRNNFKLGLDLNKENIDVSLKVIEECAKMHSFFWNKPLNNSFKLLKKHNDNLFNPSWGKFIRSMYPEFIRRWYHIIPNNVFEKMNWIVDNFDNIQNELSLNNLTLCHGDVKSGNIFYKENTNQYIPYFIDWQYIAHGKGVQDIVFFMIESFKKETIELYGNIFKQYYYIKLKEFGIINYSIDEYNNDFKNAICYYPFFVAVWFGTTPTDDLIDVSFPFLFIQKLIYFISKYL
jgi:HAD superfamily hydrolase (TIGR01509 family)